MKKLIASAAVAAAALAGTAGTANAQVSGNLVGISIEDNQVIVSDVIDIGNIAVPIGVAANVCDVNAAVLLASIEDDGETTCEAENTQRAQQGAEQVSRFDARN